ncbi:MAG: aldolase/citrate lyase family protein [Nitrospinae bacterium]|nr:aldolase/citrate lyase family protein [Nitrospinota bacterium]
MMKHNNPPQVLKVVPKNRHKDGLELIQSMRTLKNQYGASCLKLSTEDAAMSFDQIAFWTQLADGILPVMVKIGGPNARNDIKQLLAMNIDGLIAPMVESVYGLENFLTAVRDFTTPMQMQRLAKQINIETVTAVEKLDDILASPEAAFLDEITIGCSDLSQSLKKDRSDPEVQRLVKQTVVKIKAKNINVSVGGGIAPDTIDTILQDIQPHHFNTRMVTFSVHPGQSYRTAVTETLYFELKMLEHDVSKGFISRDEEKFRARQLKTRLADIPVD